MENLEEKIKNRLVQLKNRLNRLNDPNLIWIKPHAGLSLNQEINECEIKIEELNKLLDE